MFTKQRQGSLEVICGPMFSGKSEELIRRVKRAVIARQKVQVFKPAIDDRYDKAAVASHSQQKMDALAVKWPRKLPPVLTVSLRNSAH